MTTAQKSKLALQIATAVKEAAVAQEVAGVRYYPVIGSSTVAGKVNQVALSSRSQYSTLPGIAETEVMDHGASDIKDQNGRLTTSKAVRSSVTRPNTIQSMLSSAHPHAAVSQSVTLGVSPSLLPQTALAADVHGGRFSSQSNRHGAKSMCNHTPVHSFHRTKSTASNMSIGFNKQIMSAANTTELLNLVQKVGDQLDFFNISSALSRIPKLVASCSASEKQHSLSPTEVQLVNNLAALMEGKLSTFDARGLANASWAFGKLRYSTKRLPGLITQRSLEKIAEFTPQNLSNMLWSHVYLQHRDEAFLKAAATRVRQHITEFKPQELSNVVWAFASLDYRDVELLRDAAKQTMQLLDCFKEQELSNLVWAFARSEYRDPKLFTALLQPVMAKVSTLSPQGVSNIAWGLSHVGLPNAAFLKAISRHWTGRLKEFDPQALSTLTWALGAAGVKIEPLLIGLVDECLNCRDQLAPQHLSNILWACASLNFYYGPMLTPWAEAAVHAADHFEPQGLSNILWAFAKLGHFETRLYDRLADTLLSGKVDACSAQGLSNIVWAYATAGHAHTPLLTRLSERMAKAAPSFSAQNCSVSLWGLATLRHLAPATFELVLKRLASEIQSGSRNVEPQNVANTLWACARMGHDLGAHAGILRERALKQAGRMRQQELCNCFWALAVLDCLDLETFHKFCIHVGNAGGLSTEGLHQAFHAQLLFHSFLARNCPAIPQPYPALPEPLNSAAAAAWRRSASDVRVSRLQQDVSSALDAASVPNKLEVLTDDALFSIDIVVEAPGERPAALEVDGVHHFTSNAPGTPLRDVLMRRRLLQDRGWNVINLGFQQWNDLPGVTPKEKAEGLRAYVMNELELIRQQPPVFSLPALIQSLPVNLSLESLALLNLEPGTPPTLGHLNTTPHNSPSQHSQEGIDQDTHDLLQRLLALAPQGPSSVDATSNPLAGLNANLSGWLPNETNSAHCLNQLPVSLPELASYLQLQSLANPALSSVQAAFQPQVPAPSSPPAPTMRSPFMANTPFDASCLPLSFFLANDATAAVGSHANLATPGLGLCLDTMNPPATDPYASIISSLLNSYNAVNAPAPPAPMPTPNPMASLAMLGSLSQMPTSQQQGNWAAAVAAAAAREYSSLVHPTADQVCSAGMLPMNPGMLPINQGMPQIYPTNALNAANAAAAFCADTSGMGWTVWSGLPPVLSVGATLL